MFDLKMSFSQPWLLLLLIPAIALGLLPYLRTAKRYRRNRNRICSLVLHLVVMTLTIFVLSGITFTYREYNDNNEILFVVDASFSTDEQEQAKTEYINDVVNLSDSNSYKMGVVTFGYDQKYVAPLTSDYGDLLYRYETADKPNTDATDIAAALLFARDKFTSPEAAKIVLISDGVETDERASSVIRSLAADGIRVDTVCCSTLVPNAEVQIISTKYPDTNIAVGEPFDIELTVKSTASSLNHIKATLTMSEGDNTLFTSEEELTSATQTIKVRHVVEKTGLHPFKFEVTGEGDEIAENNAVYSYLYLETFDKVLIIESADGQSQQLKLLLEDYDVDILTTGVDDLPATLDELRAYDEVILNNIANSDLNDVFVNVLNSYVYEIGGGLFTVGGGEDGNPEVAHAYNRKDLAGTKLQQMLPVQAIDYTPPLGLAVIIDVSGSMAVGDKLEAAKNTATTIVQDPTCLTERDYCAVLALNDTYSEEIRPIPMTRQPEILDAIYNLSSSGGTLFSPSIERAAMDLIATKNNGLIEKMHVMLITDGAVATDDAERYKDYVRKYHAEGISFSFIAIEASDIDMNQLREAAELGGGRAINSTVKDLTIQVKDDIRVPEIKEVEYGTFTPTIDPKSYYATLVEDGEVVPTLEGFYGTRIRSNAELPIVGNYNVPIYAQWKYGKGTVGSFMCDLNNVWSADFLASDVGQRLVLGMIGKIFPTENIRPNDIDIALSEQNYTTQINLYPSTKLKEGESVRITVENLVDESYMPIVNQPLEVEGYSRSSFTATSAGVYRITAERVDADGNALTASVIYKNFSYSAEYNLATDPMMGAEYMEQLAIYGNGDFADIADADPSHILENFVTSFARSYDPRLPLIIIAIVLFLLDIAVRKFKFKWIHELIRERKNKKTQKGAQS